jgi:aminopeptidase YwaD
MTGALGNLRGASSDHASFQQAGIPAFMLHRQSDPLLHTPQDVIDRVKPELLQQAAQLGVGMLESLNTGA